MTMSRTRRFAAAAAVMLGAAGIATVAAPTAHAAPACFPIYNIAHSTTPFPHIFSEADVYCENGTEYPLTANIEKYDAATGTWTVVASGTGNAVYTCSGTATRSYRTGSGVRHRSVTAACG
jgi:hypothetical protein